MVVLTLDLALTAMNSMRAIQRGDLNGHREPHRKSLVCGPLLRALTATERERSFSAHGKEFFANARE